MCAVSKSSLVHGAFDRTAPTAIPWHLRRAPALPRAPAVSAPARRGDARALAGTRSQVRQVSVNPCTHTKRRSVGAPVHRCERGNHAWAGYRPGERAGRGRSKARDGRTHVEDPARRPDLGCRRRVVPGALALLVRYLPGPGVHAVRHDAGVQRRPARARRDLADAPPSGHRRPDLRGGGLVPPPGRRGGRSRSAAGRLRAADDARLRGAHSEQNASETEPMRFIQIWIMPAERGSSPGVEQKVFTTDGPNRPPAQVISGDDGDAVLVHQDAHVFVSRLHAGSR